MLTGELRSQVDGIWNDFWSGGLANPLQVIEQITYLIFIKRLNEMQEVEERKAATLTLSGCSNVPSPSARKCSAGITRRLPKLPTTLRCCTGHKASTAKRR